MHLMPRWLFLRALGLIYFSAFLSLIFQIKGLVGPQGILPAREYLQAIAESASQSRFWDAPTLLWFSSGSHMLMGMCWLGLLAALLVFLNILPRPMLFICFVCFLSFVSAAREFSGYQSDGMLLEAGVISLFVAPWGFRPGLGRFSLPSRVSMFLLLWEWFRIYFESGVAKIASGDPQWRHFTAMDEYYQNGPLPTWVGWYFQHLPHWFHAATAFGTLAMELVLVWMMFLPRKFRIICFFVVTPWQIGVILTANYTFLNYLVLVLGFLLLDDKFCAFAIAQVQKHLRLSPRVERAKDSAAPPGSDPERRDSPMNEGFLHPILQIASVSVSAFLLVWLFYASTVPLIWMFWRAAPLSAAPVEALEPFRVADRYGLFAVMTRGRYEIEFQGSDDGKTWVPYPFRFKPQDPSKAPKIYAPYQPRFDWNLWFASLGGWRANPMVVRTEELLLSNDRDVLALFAANPFPQKPPTYVRAMIWQYWFTSIAEKRKQGLWWRRQLLGLYAPELTPATDGKFAAVQWPTPFERPEE